MNNSASVSNVSQTSIIDPIVQMLAPVKTTCPYCGVGCGITVNKHNNGVSVVGDSYHPANLGKLCIKGKNLDKTLSNDKRLEMPMVNGHAVNWPRALDLVASKFSAAIKQYGPDSVAFYVSGQLLTEDYYVANKLMKGFIGSGNIDTNSRLCMSSAVAAHKRAFGEDIVPLSYSDILASELIVLAGSNLAWCHPVLYQRIRQEKQRRPSLKVVVIDPRKTASLELADLHLPIKAGSDLVLFQGLLTYLNELGLIDSRLNGVEDALAAATLVTQSSATNKLHDIGLSEAQIKQFFEWFSRFDKVVTVFSQGINQSQSGSDSGSAIINCHVGTGKIGKEGSGPFSITGQPNAMGGREVGALANTLASHIEFDDTALHQPLREFWQTDNLATTAGLKAVDLFDAISKGDIKAVWIMATNPVVSMPDNHKIIQALKTCELVVVSDCVASNDTIDLAHVVLPAQGWGEKNGSVTNSERRISRQRRFLTPFGQAKPDWWIISQVAQRMGFSKAFNYQSPAEIFREHAALSGLNNNGSRAFDISSFDNITETQYQHWLPKQWPQPKGVAICLSDQRLFENKRYFTSNDTANMVTPQPIDLTERQADVFLLNTGRYRDQWHTQTRSAKAPSLTHRHPEPLLDIHPDDAKKLLIHQHEILQVRGNDQSLSVRVNLTTDVNKGELFMPIHWSKANTNSGCVSKLITNIVDPISGQPAFKQVSVTLKKLNINSEALVMVRQPLIDLDQDYYIEQAIQNGYCYHIASCLPADKLYQQLSQKLVEIEGMSVNRVSEGYFQVGYFDNEKMLGGGFVSAKRCELPTGWSSDFFNSQKMDDIKRELLHRHAQDVVGKGTFCQCLNVDLNQLNHALDSGALSVKDIQQKTGAGNGCGSCIGDILATIELRQRKVKSAS